MSGKASKSKEGSSTPLRSARTMLSKEELRRKLVAEALKQLGKPYKYGAWWQEAPERFDCSSFTQWVYKQIGIQIERVSIDQAEAGRRIRPQAGKLAAGDLIYLRGTRGRYNRKFPQGIGHVVMVISTERVIEAKSVTKNGKECGRVRLTPLADIMKRGDITVVKRII